MIGRLVLLFVLLLFGAVGAGAQTFQPVGFDKAFNAASKRIGTGVVLTTVGCKPSECEFGAVPDLRILVSSDSGNTDIEQVSAYLPRDISDKDRSRRSAILATSVVATLIAVFSPKVPAKRRGDAVMALLNGATSPRQRGEIDLGGINYVMNATQADNLRIYVTR